LAEDGLEDSVEVQPETQVSERTNVTPLRSVTPTRETSGGTMDEILTVRPTRYADAAEIAENFRIGTPVIINLSRMNDAEAVKLIDFSSGLVTGLQGRIQRIAAKVFVLTPAHIAISGEEEQNES